MLAPASVTHLLPPEPFGGAQALAIKLAGMQRRRGIDARVLLTAFGAVAAERCAASGVPSSSPASDASRGNRFQFTVTQLLRQSPSILHLHLPPPWIALVLKILREQATVLHLHAAPPPANRFLNYIAAGALLTRADDAIAVSKWISEKWRCAFPSRRAASTVVYNAVDLPDRFEIRTEVADGAKPVFGTASRLSADKGLDVFLRVAAVIIQLRPDAVFRIAGVGPELSRLQSFAAKLRIDQAIAFEGFVNDMDAFWRGIDVSIFTAPNDSFGLSLLEPIVAGAGVVAFRTGAGSDEVLDHCPSIVTAPAGDIGAAARKALALALDRHHRDLSLESARFDIRRWFSFDRMEAAVQESYGRALASKRVH